MKHSLAFIVILAISFGITLFLVLGRGRGSDALNTSKTSTHQTGVIINNTVTQERNLPKQSPIQKGDDKVLVSNNEEDFYRTIIENNIFRPLNWKPTRQDPAYILIGTLVPSDDSTATAYISERKTDQFYTVKVGEKIGNATVTAILPKHVTLDKEGKALNLYMASASLLSRTRSGRSSSYRPSPQPQVTSQNRNSQTRSTTDKERQAWRDTQKERIAELKEMAEKLRAVSEEERSRMQEHLEQRASRNSQ